MTAHRTQGKMELFDPKEISDSISPYQFVSSTVKDFTTWWYIKQPILFIKQYIRLIDVIDDRFSTSFLIRTFLVPWHRDKQFVGYLVGMIVRLIFIPVGLIMIAIATTGYLSLILFWILIPITSVIMAIISPFI
ncbi:hypothetical protein HYV12_00335 [Candidatus Dojkabacteria bacterium]|nr:hypothetical protein [Candidatus Dojkabacteria bacterium]